MYYYPAILTPDENGATIVEFPDVPEAISTGMGIDEALTNAQSALEMALTEYMEQRRDIPTPSKPKRRQAVVALPAMSAVKTALYQAMRDQKVTQVELAKRLTIDGREVRRMLDLKHRSSFDKLVGALAAVGKYVDVIVRDTEDA